MIKFFRNKFGAPQGVAFPGDTYIQDLHNAANTGRPWVKYLALVLIFCFLADLQFLQITVDYVLPDSGILSWVIGGTLVVLYIFLGIIFGKKLREYKVFKDKSSLIIAIVSLIVLVIALYSLTVFRISAESTRTTSASISEAAMIESMMNSGSSDDSGIEIDNDNTTKKTVGDVMADLPGVLGDERYIDAVRDVFIMTLMMCLSAFIGAVYAYYKGDPVSSKIYRISASCLPADKSLYYETFWSFNNSAIDRQYEPDEYKIDHKAVDCIIELGSIASQLNGMVDPADAHEFLNVQRLIRSNYFN